MRIIDAHLHFSNSEGLKETARGIAGVEYSATGLKKEFTEANVALGIVMTTPVRDHSQVKGHPFHLALEDGGMDSLVACVGVNPQLLQKDKNELAIIEEELKKDHVIGIKLYPGYFPYYVYDQIYDPIYQLARKYNVPVAIHCGDTQWSQGLLKYSHPLTIDELAVTHQDINFVICHFGVPWVMDTAELIAKNPNVYADLSGLLAGNEGQVLDLAEKKLYIQLIQQGLAFAQRYDKVLFGSDWPLVPIRPYVQFIKELIPAKYQEDVFFNNALAVYPKIKKYL